MMVILPTDLQTRHRSELSGENPVGGGPGPPPRMDPVGGGEPADPGDPGALIGRGDCRRAGGDAAYAERAEMGTGEGERGKERKMLLTTSTSAAGTAMSRQRVSHRVARYS